MFQWKRKRRNVKISKSLIIIRRSKFDKTNLSLLLEMDVFDKVMKGSATTLIDEQESAKRF